MPLTVPKQRQRHVIDTSFVLPPETDRMGRLVYPVKRDSKSRDQTPCRVTLDAHGHVLWGTCPDWIYGGVKDGMPCKHMEAVTEKVVLERRRAVLAPWGLPTYPIYHRMPLGERSLPELFWLLEHGTLQDKDAVDAFYRVMSDGGKYRLTYHTLEMTRRDQPSVCWLQEESLRDFFMGWQHNRLLRPLWELLPTWQWYAF